jgi:hypothetical protein
MKTQVKFFQLIIAIAISALISFGFYSMDIEENKLLITIGGFVFFAVTLACTIGIRFETAGVSTNVSAQKYKSPNFSGSFLSIISDHTIKQF